MPYKVKTEETRRRARESQMRYYECNKGKYRAYADARRSRIHQWVREYKAERGCSRCPENHPAALDFHHLESETKEANIAKAVTRGWSEKRLRAEIEKCITLCANCHRKEHDELG